MHSAWKVSNWDFISAETYRFAQAQNGIAGVCIFRLLSEDGASEDADTGEGSATNLGGTRKSRRSSIDRKQAALASYSNNKRKRRVLHQTPFGRLLCPAVACGAERAAWVMQVAV
jgi:hypothetical protein